MVSFLLGTKYYVITISREKISIFLFRFTKNYGISSDRVAIRW